MSLPPPPAVHQPYPQEPSPRASASRWTRSATPSRAPLLRVLLAALGLLAIPSCLPTADDEKGPPEILLRTPSALAPDSISWTCPEARGTASPAGSTLSAHPEGVLASFPGLEDGCSDSIRLGFWKEGLVIARTTYPPAGLQGGRLVRDPVGATLVERLDSARTSGNASATPVALLAEALVAGDSLLRDYPRSLPEGLSTRAIDSAALRRLAATGRPLSTLSPWRLSRDSTATDSLLQSWIAIGTISVADYDALRNTPLAIPRVVTLLYGLALLEDRGIDTAIIASGPAPLTVTLVPRDTLVLPPRLQAIAKGPGDTWRVHLQPAPQVHAARTQVVVSISDGATTRLDSFAIAILAINDAPTFTPGPDIFVAENSPARTIPGWATAILAGPEDEQGQKLRFAVSTSDPSFYTLPPAIDASGSLSFTLRPGMHGVDTVHVRLRDDGGTERGGIDSSAPATFTIATDRPPTLSPLADRTINEDDSASIAITVADGETEADDLTFTATSLDTAIIAPSGLRLVGTGVARTLVARPRPNAYGQARIVLSVTDASGLAAHDTMTLFINSLNDVPTLRPLADTAIAEDGTTGPRALLVGDAETDPAMLLVSVRSTNTALIPQSSIVVGGTGRDRTLTAKPLADQFGIDTLLVTVTDGGGATVHDTIVVSVDPVNDAPFFETTQDTLLIEGSIQRQARAAFAKSLRAGPVNESGQSVALRIGGNTNPGLFVGPVEISPEGELSFIPDRNARGTATITIAAEDQAGTARGGIDRLARTVDITVINTFTDARDGKVYRFVRIGSQVWLAQNLYTRPLQGEYVCFKDSCEKYGAAYTWSQAMGLPDSCDEVDCPGRIPDYPVEGFTRYQGLCPDGWRIASGDEFQDLVNETGGDLKSTAPLRSLEGWKDESNAGQLDFPGTDAYGFNLESIQSTATYWDFYGRYPSSAYVFSFSRDYFCNCGGASMKDQRSPIRCIKS